jgi:hypothetical protein
MTQDVYMGRKVADPAAAGALEGAFGEESDGEQDGSVGIRVLTIMTDRANTLPDQMQKCAARDSNPEPAD